MCVWKCCFNRCPTLQADSLPAKPPGTWCTLYRAWDPNIHFFPEPQTLFENRISVDVVLWDEGVLDPITCSLIKKPRGDTDIYRGTPTMWRWRKKLGTLLPQAGEHQRLLASTGSWDGHARTLPWRLLREHGPADSSIPDFCSPELWGASVLGQPSICGPRKATQNLSPRAPGDPTCTLWSLSLKRCSLTSDHLTSVHFSRSNWYMTTNSLTPFLMCAP